MKEKVILVDCDGVLFDWEYAFDQWMKKHGYKVIEPVVNTKLKRNMALQNARQINYPGCSMRVPGLESYLN